MRCFDLLVAAIARTRTITRRQSAFYLQLWQSALLVSPGTTLGPSTSGIADSLHSTFHASQPGAPDRRSVSDRRFGGDALCKARSTAADQRSSRVRAPGRISVPSSPRRPTPPPCSVAGESTLRLDRAPPPRGSLHTCQPSSLPAARRQYFHVAGAHAGALRLPSTPQIAATSRRRRTQPARWCCPRPALPCSEAQPLASRPTRTQPGRTRPHGIRCTVTRASRARRTSASAAPADRRPHFAHHVLQLALRAGVSELAPNKPPQHEACCEYPHSVTRRSRYCQYAVARLYSTCRILYGIEHGARARLWPRGLFIGNRSKLCPLILLTWPL